MVSVSGVRTPSTLPSLRIEMEELQKQNEEIKEEVGKDECRLNERGGNEREEEDEEGSSRDSTRLLLRRAVMMLWTLHLPVQLCN